MFRLVLDFMTMALAAKCPGISLADGEYIFAEDPATSRKAL